MKPLFKYYQGRSLGPIRLMVYFEGKWRESGRLAIMLKRRHTPEIWGVEPDTGRSVYLVVGSWDMTKKEWDRYPKTKSHAVHMGSVFSRHDHDWDAEGNCKVCNINVKYLADAMLKLEAIS